MSDTIETTIETTTESTVDFAALVATAQTRKAAVEAAQLEYEASLRAVAEIHPTFEVNGQWYQVRHREESKLGRPLTYICELDAEPKTWLGGKRGPRKTKTGGAVTTAEAPAMASVADAVASDAESAAGTVVIE